MKQRTWTLEQRLNQSKKISQHKPWEHSTGPKTPEGKVISSNNSLKHGARCKEVRDMQTQLSEWKSKLNKFIHCLC